MKKNPAETENEVSSNVYISFSTENFSIWENKKILSGSFRSVNNLENRVLIIRTRRRSDSVHTLKQKAKTNYIKFASVLEMTFNLDSPAWRLLSSLTNSAHQTLHLTAPQLRNAVKSCRNYTFHFIFLTFLSRQLLHLQVRNCAML